MHRDGRLLLLLTTQAVSLSITSGATDGDRFFPAHRQRAGVALAQLHERGIVHKDIKPANVLVDADRRVRPHGLRHRLAACRASARRPAAPEVIAGTLAYMAPEQTGRMNRSIDSRSDLYSLGVTLYEMLTGALPFTAADPMEWVHCHIARQPTPPSERVRAASRSRSRPSS